MNIDLPQNLETERLLLGALLVMRPSQRDSIIGRVSATWFVDPWHRKFFNILVRNRGRDFGRQILDDAKEGDGTNDRTGWWISQLLVDDQGNGTSGNPARWAEYAHSLEKLAAWRIKILIKLEEVRDCLDAANAELAPIREPAKTNAPTNARVARPAAGIVLDGSPLG